MKYYAITAKHGHFGSNRFEPITFAVQSESLLSAIDYVKTMPGVKHDSPSVIIGAREIAFEEYRSLRSKSAYERMYKNAYDRGVHAD